MIDAYFAVFSNVRNIALPRATAVSSASLAVFWPAERGLDLLGPDVAHLHHVAEAQAARILGRLLVGELLQRRLQNRVLLVEAGRLGLLVGRLGDRQIAGFLMQLGLAVGVGQEGEELRDALVFLGFLAAHHPQRRAADDRVLRGALNIGIVRHRRRGEIELRGALRGRVIARRGQEDRAFAGAEAAFAGAGAAGIVVGLVLLQIDQVLQMLDVQRRVEFQHGVEAVEAVGLGADRHVVPGRKLFDMRPGHPGVGEAAGIVAGGLQLLGGVEHFRPGLRNFGDAGLFQFVLVDPHHHRGGIEGKRQHVALRCRVVAGDGRQIGFRIERLAGILHQLVDRLDGAGGAHHGRGADLEHLHDVRRVAGTERGDAGVHGIGVAAFVGRDHLVVRLAGVELFGELVDDIVVAAGHGVPPLDLGHRVRRRGAECQCSRHCCSRAELSKTHQSSSRLDRHLSFARVISAG